MRINNIRRVLALLLTFMLACVPVVAMADTLTSTKEELLATIEDICFCMEESRAIKKLEVMIDSSNQEDNIKLIFGSTNDYINSVDGHLLAKTIYNMVIADDLYTASVENFEEAMDKAVLCAALNEGLGDIGSLIEIYSIEADYADIYDNELLDECKSSFVDTYYKDKGISTEKGIVETFNTGLIYSFHHSFDSWYDAVLFLEVFGADIGIDMVGYDEMKTVQKVELYEFIVETKIDSDLNEYARTINSKIIDICSSGMSGNVDGGWGNGGFNGGIVILPKSYTINALRVLRLSDGASLDTIPTGDFVAEVSITNVSAETTDTIVLAAYDADGVLQSLTYMYMTIDVGKTATMGTLFHNSDGKISTIKAFMWTSFSGLKPLSGSSVFPK